MWSWITGSAIKNKWDHKRRNRLEWKKGELTLHTIVLCWKYCQVCLGLLKLSEAFSLDLWVIYTEIRGGHKSIQVKPKEERRSQGPQNCLWISSVWGISIIRKLYVLLKYTVKRCTNLLSMTLQNKTLLLFVWYCFLLERTCVYLFIYLFLLLGFLYLWKDRIQILLN